jgi:hypothetical protein
LFGVEVFDPADEEASGEGFAFAGGEGGALHLRDLGV